MKKFILMLSVLILVAGAGQAQRHYRVRGYGGYHGGGYHYARPYYGGYGRSYLGLSFGLGLGLGFYSSPYYGYAYPPYYGYAYPPAYPPGYAPPPPAYQYPDAPPNDSTGRAPQQNNSGNNNDGGYNPGNQQGEGSADNNTQGPKPTRTWVASHWEHRSTGWVWVEGYWK